MVEEILHPTRTIEEELRLPRMGDIPLIGYPQRAELGALVLEGIVRQRIGHLYPLDTPYLGDDTEGLELIPTYHLDLIGDRLYLTYLVGIIGGRATWDVLPLGALTRIAGQGKKSH